MSNLKLAFSVFMSRDVKIARQLIAEKASLRAAELAAAESHLERLRERRPESIESSSLHLDVLRDLKRTTRTSVRLPIQCSNARVPCSQAVSGWLIRLTLRSTIRTPPRQAKP